MKALFTILSLLLFAAPSRAAEEADEAVSAIGLLPSQRLGQHVTPQERNPFAVHTKELNRVAQTEETETQESHIRAIFKLLEVTGVRRDGHGRLMALAGDLILREGEELKPVMVDQTETLVVSKLEPSKVELTFIENKDSTQPRTIILPVKTQVLVSQKLFGQPKGSRNFYTVTGKKAADPAIAATIAAVQQVPGGASGAVSSWQSPPVSVVSAMAGLTGLFPRAPSSEDDRPTEPSPISPQPQANPAPGSTPGVSADKLDTNAAVEPGPIANPPAGKDSPAPPGSPAEPKRLVPIPAGGSLLPPAAGPAVPAGTAVPAPTAPEQVSPPTHLRRHGEDLSAEPEARAARPAVAPPAAGVSPAVVE